MIVWFLIVYHAAGGVTNIATASEAACNTARAALVAAPENTPAGVGMKNVRYLGAVCVPVEVK
jgi:predicted small secreted protein